MEYAILVLQIEAEILRRKASSEITNDSEYLKFQEQLRQINAAIKKLQSQKQ